MERFKQLSIIILPVILCLFTLPIFAQDAVITYGNGESVTLKLKQDTYSVYIQEKESLPFFVSDTSFITAHVASLRLSTYEKEQLSNNNPNVFINPVFEDGRGNIAHVDNKINLYMYDPITATALQKLLDADELNLTVQEKFWRDGRLATYHTLAISFPYRDVSIVELTNRVNKLPGVKMAFPNLIHRITPTSSIHGITDTYYSNQWEHRKIESELAWAITMGDANIRIGILDNGVDHEHEDLTDNIWRDGQGNVMGGDFTSDGFSTGRPYGDESHGTHCAGLAAAPINGDGVVGAAPGVSLVPLKIATGQTGTVRSWQVSESGFLDAMDYAIDNDIDVLSASWGLNWWYGNVSLLNQAFEDIIDEGRNGKGIVMVYGAGNDGSNWNMFNMVSYRDEVITVGGTNPQDQRWPGSSYSPTGTIVDIAAPTGWTSSNGVSNYTTDIEGSSGESSGDYVAYFGGTSGAAPVVAGAAALLLSMDNQLTHQEVKNLLYNNAEKVGGYSYSYPGNMSSELGHGRLNMFQALKWLIPLQYSSVNFTTNSFLNSAHLFGSTTISNGVTLTTITGSVTVLSGNISSASASNLIVNGKLIIESTTSLSGINIEIKPGGILFISENATLNSGNILINSGGQLIIHEGAVLSFASGQGITAYGKVTIDNATLQKQGAPRWAGLILQGSGADGSSITYSTIKGSVNGVQIVGADDTWIWQNVIEDHQNNGMYVSSANGTQIGWTTFRDNGGSGLVTDFSDVHFGIYNRFQDNTGDGLLADGSSFLHFGGVGDPGGAVFRGNRYGVYAKSTSWVHLGEDNYPYANTGGNNSIYWNLTKEVRVDMGSNVKAQLTWWGTSSPSAALFEDNPPFSVVDWSSWLTVAPVTKMAVDLPPELFSGASQAPIISDAEGHAAATVWQRLSAAGDGRIDKLHTLMQDAELSRAASFIGISEYLRSGHFSLLHNLAEDMLHGSGFERPVQEQAYILRAQFTACLLEGDLPGARIMLSQLKEIEEPARVAVLAALLPDGEAGGSTDEPLAESYLLAIGNYPNPFNPVTTITYTLPSRSHVNLVVYDLLGREVAELVNEVREPGVHTVPFDASALSSGIYLYRLTAGNQVFTNRMTLIK